MCAVVVDEIVQTVEHDVLDEKVLCLSAFLLRTNATVIHAWWVAPDQKKHTHRYNVNISLSLSLSLKDSKQQFRRAEHVTVAHQNDKE
jgi:hypothetical protein